MIDDTTQETEAGGKKAFNEQSPKEVRQKVKESVEKVIATVAGAIEGFNEEMKKNDLPEKTKEAVEQVGDTLRKVLQTGKEEVQKTMESFRGGGSSNDVESDTSSFASPSRSSASRRSTTFRPTESQTHEPESVRQAREDAKVKVQRGVASVAGAVEGVSEEMQHTKFPQKAEAAMKKVGETTRNVGHMGKEQYEKTKLTIQGGSSAGSSSPSSSYSVFQNTPDRDAFPSARESGEKGRTMPGSKNQSMRAPDSRTSAKSSGRPYEKSARDASGGLQQELGGATSRLEREKAIGSPEGESDQSGGMSHALERAPGPTPPADGGSGLGSTSSEIERDERRGSLGGGSGGLHATRGGSDPRGTPEYERSLGGVEDTDSPQYHPEGRPRDEKRRRV